MRKILFIWGLRLGLGWALLVVGVSKGYILMAFVGPTKPLTSEAVNQNAFIVDERCIQSESTCFEMICMFPSLTTFGNKNYWKLRCVFLYEKNAGGHIFFLSI